MVDDAFAFIVGSPRSGTTILGKILDGHDNIAQWYEPYFIWDKKFRNARDDVRSAMDCTPAISRYIYNKFRKYKKRRGCRVVIDKSPRNSLKIPFIRHIFPNAKFVHIIRDGRDATLSIHKEWQRRMSIVEGQGREKKFNYREAFKTITKWLERQPFIDDKMRALYFETRGNIFNKTRHLNRLRWNGEVGWGPQFADWKDAKQRYTLLQFNAMQWERCVSSILQHWDDIPEANRLQFRYEDMLTQPERIFVDLMNFLDVSVDEAFFQFLPTLKVNNFNKWQTAFAPPEIEEIKPILTPMLQQLGYLATTPW
ncbi:MAG: sulfotransferase [Thermodesulfobacteriota bacterium]|nr:sulfotransferase [Thermodesulfobacteriota bacterium]